MSRRLITFHRKTSMQSIYIHPVSHTTQKSTKKSNLSVQANGKHHPFKIRNTTGYKKKHEFHCL